MPAPLSAPPPAPGSPLTRGLRSRRSSRLLRAGRPRPTAGQPRPTAGRPPAGLVGALAVLLAVVTAGPARAAPTALPRTAAASGWIWPLQGPHEVSRPFDPPEHRYGVGHRGADLPGFAGQPVLAAGPGRVSYAGMIAGRGVVVVVHGALRTTYEPVTAVVAVDEQVTAGSWIGVLDAGHLGCPVEACLHWGLKRGEDYLDPVRLVERGPSRLLPLGGGPPSGSSPATDRSWSRGAAAPPPLVGAAVGAALVARAGGPSRARSTSSEAR